MVADVVVRHCVLTVRGRGGWGWGSDANGYLAAALPAIEQALERLLRECEIDPNDDVWIEKPISLSWARDGTLADGLRQDLVAQIRREAGEVVEAEPFVTQSQVVRETDAGGASTLLPNEKACDGARAVASLLGAWSQSGRMREIVASWPARVVSLWLEAVGTTVQGTDQAELDAPAVAAIAELVLAVERTQGEQSRADDRLLLLLAALVAAVGDRPLGRTTFESAVRLAGSSAGGAVEPIVSAWLGESSGRSSESEGAPSKAEMPVGVRLSRRGLPRRVIVPGLPFLVTVQLSRIGYLDALVAVAEVAQEPVVAQLIAAGVAGKVLPPPERGWRRHRTEIDALAGVSGLAAGIDSTAYEVRDKLELMVPPLQSALISLYAAGRSAPDEVVVTESAEGAMCGEAAGALPIAWLPDGGDLDPVLDQLGRPPLRHADVFALLIRELSVRSAFPHLDLPGVERLAGVLVGAALGSIAQELWGTEVPNAPLLALERLADLEVELRYDEVLSVAIPRGQRWLDLRGAGLLDHWSIPWAVEEHWELVSW